MLDRQRYKLHFGPYRSIFEAKGSNRVLSITDEGMLIEEQIQEIGWRFL